MSDDARREGAEPAPSRPPSILVVLVVPVIALLAVGFTQLLAPDDGTSAAAPTGGNAILIKNFAFAPPTITAAPGRHDRCHQR